MHRSAFIIHLASAIAASPAGLLAHDQRPMSRAPVDCDQRRRDAIDDRRFGRDDGVRYATGHQLFDLTVSGGTSGNITATLTLTSERLENLAKGLAR